MIFNIPGSEDLEINTIILDLNGTLSVGGRIDEAVFSRINTLKKLGYRIVLFTGNTRNDADKISKLLNIDWQLAKSGQDKKALALELVPDTCASIGNGRIDLELMKVVKLSIVTLQAEGVHVSTLLNSDIVVPNILDAFDLFIDPDRLIATLRK